MGCSLLGVYVEEEKRGKQKYGELFVTGSRDGIEN